MTNIEKIRQEIERRKKENMYDDLPITIGRYYEDRDLLAFIDSLPEDDPLNDPKFCEGFDVGRKVQKIFDEPEEKPSKDLEEAADEYAISLTPCDQQEELNYFNSFIAGAKWMESQMPMPEDTVIFMKGIEEGRRLEREDRNDDKLPRYYGD